MATMTAAIPEFKLSLSASAAVDCADEQIRVSAYGQSVRGPAPVLTGVLALLAGPGATEEEVMKRAVEDGDATALISLVGVLRALNWEGYWSGASFAKVGT